MVILFSSCLVVSNAGCVINRGDMKLLVALVGFFAVSNATFSKAPYAIPSSGAPVGESPPGLLEGRRAIS